MDTELLIVWNAIVKIPIKKLIAWCDGWVRGLNIILFFAIGYIIMDEWEVMVCWSQALQFILSCVWDLQMISHWHQCYDHLLSHLTSNSLLQNMFGSSNQFHFGSSLIDFLACHPNNYRKEIVLVLSTSSWGLEWDAMIWLMATTMMFGSNTLHHSDGWARNQKGRFEERGP